MFQNDTVNLLKNLDLGIFFVYYNTMSVFLRKQDNNMKRIEVNLRFAETIYIFLKEEKNEKNHNCSFSRGNDNTFGSLFRAAAVRKQQWTAGNYRRAG